MGKFGVDISVHNGVIDFAKLKNEVSFVMIRAGYGQNNIDTRCEANIQGCERYGIPYGLYWFSYSLNDEMAIREANCLCDIADKYHPVYPLCYDWEYDSDKYAKSYGADVSKAAMLSKAKSFLEVVRQRGYRPMLYTNLDYLNKGFGELTNKYDIWLAQWGTNLPSVSCAIWQTTSSGRIDGVNGYIDKDISYIDYTSLQNDNKNDNDNNEINDEKKKIILDRLTEWFWKSYTNLAKEIMEDKYGKGEERKKKIEALGYNYHIAQIFVNAIYYK